MKTSYFASLLFLWLSLSINVYAQEFDGLHKLNDPAISLYYSSGHETRAKDIATLTKNALAFNQNLLGFKPEVTILVLSPNDWSSHTNFPVYGMAHYNNNKTLIVASSDNEFWKSFIPPLDQLPVTLAEEVKNTYTSADGQLSMQPFFDLLALHELGHAFHLQGGLTMQRKWMGELFCNVLLHTYIAEKEPEQLAALTIFPKMVVNNGTHGFKFTTLPQLETNYTMIAKEHSKNYGWYQSRLHMAAKNIYDAAGKDALVKLWNTLKATTALLNDDAYADVLQQKVHPAVADIMLSW